MIIKLLKIETLLIYVRDGTMDGWQDFDMTQTTHDYNDNDTYQEW